MSIKVLILSPYPFKESPSQRFRFEQYLDYLGNEGVIFTHVSFYSRNTLQILYSNKLLLKILRLLTSYVISYKVLLMVNSCETVFIHREFCPLGPPVHAWFIKHVFRKKIIFDFDDAIWLSNVSDVNRKFNFLKSYWKVKYLIKWSVRVSVGNEFLAMYAKKYNNNVIVIPSTVNMETVHVGIKDYSNKNKMVIGWTGSHTTSQYLFDLKPVFQRLIKNMVLKYRSSVINH